MGDVARRCSGVDASWGRKKQVRDAPAACARRGSAGRPSGGKEESGGKSSARKLEDLPSLSAKLASRQLRANAREFLDTAASANVGAFDDGAAPTGASEDGVRHSSDSRIYHRASAIGRVSPLIEEPELVCIEERERLRQEAQQRRRLAELAAGEGEPFGPPGCRPGISPLPGPLSSPVRDSSTPVDIGASSCRLSATTSTPGGRGGGGGSGEACRSYRNGRGAGDEEEEEDLLRLISQVTCQTPANEREVFVGGLREVEPDICEAELIQHFAKFGSVEEVSVNRDGRTQRQRGFAFVRFADEGAALAVVTAPSQAHLVRGATLTVQWSKGPKAKANKNARGSTARRRAPSARAGQRHGARTPVVPGQSLGAGQNSCTPGAGNGHSSGSVRGPGRVPPPPMGMVFVPVGRRPQPESCGDNSGGMAGRYGRVTGPASSRTPSPLTAAPSPQPGQAEERTTSPAYRPQPRHPPRRQQQHQPEQQQQQGGQTRGAWALPLVAAGAAGPPADTGAAGDQAPVHGQHVVASAKASPVAPPAAAEHWAGDGGSRPWRLVPPRYGQVAATEATAAHPSTA